MGGLITTFGPQNLHVMRSGLTRSNVGAVISVCCLGDLFLVVCGVIGFSSLISADAEGMFFLKAGAFALLMWYASQAIARASCSTETAYLATISNPIRTAFILTFLNPCVYLDTVLLVGLRANLHGDLSRWWFAFGSVIASTLWYCALGFGSQRLSLFFNRPSVLRKLDRITAIILYINAWQISRM